ncbi:ABC transporter substrate-binding protein [Mesorhizobium sp. L-8-3]|uniref:ABC transporter substrate-binding protein n=1 Tax=Mesorhizobium sp. L-8-3 TaxID=2744522 RepID=UPI001926DC0D|nr:ABC transporter substrate-binding protein [Mesorhizobium sp. L-8-3]BCH27547.1 ABC transporter substrate-binding protein [Mesorhizobium sp. L-8-3]
MLRKALLAAVAALLPGTAGAIELKVGSANMAPYLDPGRDHSNVGSQFYYNSFDVLIERDYASSEPKFKPGLALSWQLVEPTVMEFKLREGVTFHNGEAMTADDVVFSFNRMFQSSFPPYQVRAKDRLGNFDKAEKVDDFTLRVHVKRPEPLWETLINMQQLMVIPEDYTKGLTGDPKLAEHSDYEAFSLAPVGTGPYRIAEFIPGERLVWQRHDAFWGEPAPLDKVTVLKVPEMASRITALKNSEVDVITNVPPDQLSTIEADQNLKVEGMVTPLFHVLIFNTQNEKMKDPKFRRALSLAVDRDTLNEALWLGKAVVPSSHTYPQFGPLYMPELKTFEYDPEEAKKLLAESGYKGEEIRFDTSAVYYTNGLLAAQAIQEMWAGIGVKLAINVDDKWTGNDPTMNVRNWSNPLYFADPFGSFGVMWAPGGPSEGEGRFKPDADYAAAWEKFRFSDSLEDRRAAYADLMERIRKDPPFLVLYQPYESWGLRKSVNWAPKPGHIPYVLDFRAGSIDFAAN